MRYLRNMPTEREQAGQEENQEMAALAERLETIGERLADLGIEILREAVELAAGDSENDQAQTSAKMPPALAQREKQLARARRAVLKAAAVLRIESG